MPITVAGTQITFNDSTVQSTSAAGAGTRRFIYPSSTTWVCPTGITSVFIYCFGGGGGAGTNFGRSGGQGGYAEGTYTVVPGTTYTITIGAGGSAGTPAGSAGGETWFGVNSSSKLVSATGGAGGPNNSGTASNGIGVNGTTRNTSVGGRSLFLGATDRTGVGTPGIAYTLTSEITPGARGVYFSCGCSAFFCGGVGGAIFLEY